MTMIDGPGKIRHICQHKPRIIDHVRIGSVPTATLVTFMPPKKRGASTSPVPHPDAKRLPLPDQWSEDEHRLQDEIVKQRLSGKASRAHPLDYDINNLSSMAGLLTIVGKVAFENPQPHLFRVLSYEDYIDALAEDPNLMKLAGESYMSSSFKAVRCLSASFCIPTPNSNPDFFLLDLRETSSSASAPKVNLGQVEGMSVNKLHSSHSLMVRFSCSKIMGT
jgi:hypothetical protein